MGLFEDALGTIGGLFSGGGGNPLGSLPGLGGGFGNGFLGGVLGGAPNRFSGGSPFGGFPGSPFGGGGGFPSPLGGGSPFGMPLPQVNPFGLNPLGGGFPPNPFGNPGSFYPGQQQQQWMPPNATSIGIDFGRRGGGGPEASMGPRGQMEYAQAYPGANRMEQPGGGGMRSLASGPQQFANQGMRYVGNVGVGGPFGSTWVDAQGNKNPNWTGPSTTPPPAGQGWTGTAPSASWARTGQAAAPPALNQWSGAGGAPPWSAANVQAPMRSFANPPLPQRGIPQMNPSQGDWQRPM